MKIVTSVKMYPNLTLNCILKSEQDNTSVAIKRQNNATTATTTTKNRPEILIYIITNI